MEKTYIPYDITFHPKWWRKYSSVSFKEPFFTDYKFRIEEDLKMRRTLYDKLGHLGFGEKNPQPRPLIDTDLVAGEYLQAHLFGCEVKYYEDSYPEVITRKMSDEEIKQLEEPSLDKNEFWINIEEQMEELIDKFGYVESYLDLYGVQNLALDLRGQQLFIDYYQKPDLIKRLFSVITNTLINVGMRIKEKSDTLSCGVTSIMHQINPKMFVTSNCTVELVSQEIYEKHLLEWDKKLAKAFNSFGIHHCGQSAEHVAYGYKKVPNLSFLEVGAFSDIKKVSQIFPDISLNLRYSPVKLKEVTRKELKNDLLTMIKDGAPIERISVSCVGIDDTTPIHKVENFITTIQEISHEIF